MAERKLTRFDSDIIIRGNTYWYRGTPVGFKQRIERSLKLKVDGEGVTQKKVKKAKAELLESLERVSNKAKSTKFEYVSNEYIKEREVEFNEGSLSEKRLYEIKSLLGVKYTYNGKRYIGKHLGPFLRKYNLEEITQSVFIDFCKANDGKRFKNHCEVLNSFLRWCVRSDYLKYRPEIFVPKFAKKEPRKRQILTDDEIVNLFKNIEGRPLLYVSMYMLMGMRGSEIYKLKWSSVFLDKKALIVKRETSKTRKERVIPVNRFVYGQLVKLSEYIETNKKNLLEKDIKWVFPNKRKSPKKPHMDPSGFRRQWKKALESAGITRHLTPHDMRATFEKFMHLNKSLTNTQMEKMAGASVDIQKKIYVTLDVSELGNAAESVNVDGLDEIFNKKSGAKSGAK